MKRHAAYLCRRFDGELVTAETDTDHIHLLVSLPPQVCPADLIRTLKTQLSKEVHLNETYNAYVQKYLPVVAVLFYCDDWHQCTGKGEGIHQRTKDR